MLQAWRIPFRACEVSCRAGAERCSATGVAVPRAAADAPEGGGERVEPGSPAPARCARSDPAAAGRTRRCRAGCVELSQRSASLEHRRCRDARARQCGADGSDVTHVVAPGPTISAGTLFCRRPRVSIEHMFEVDSGDGATAGRCPALTTAQLRQVRDELARLVRDVGDAERVDQIRLLEELKSAAAAAQARVTADFHASQVRRQREQGLPERHLGRGRREPGRVWRSASRRRGHAVSSAGRASSSPSCPRTFGELQAGRITEWRAQIVARETAWLSLEHRRQVDEEVGPAARAVGRSTGRGRGQEVRVPAGSPRVPEAARPRGGGTAGHPPAGSGLHVEPQRLPAGGAGRERPGGPATAGGLPAQPGRRPHPRPDHGRHPGRAGDGPGDRRRDPGPGGDGHDRPDLLQHRRWQRRAGAPDRVRHRSRPSWRDAWSGSPTRRPRPGSDGCTPTRRVGWWPWSRRAGASRARSGSSS